MIVNKMSVITITSYHINSCARVVYKRIFTCAYPKTYYRVNTSFQIFDGYNDIFFLRTHNTVYNRFDGFIFFQTVISKRMYYKEKNVSKNLRNANKLYYNRKKRPRLQKNFTKKKMSRVFAWIGFTAHLAIKRTVMKKHANRNKLPSPSDRKHSRTNLTAVSVKRIRERCTHTRIRTYTHIYSYI